MDAQATCLYFDLKVHSDKNDFIFRKYLQNKRNVVQGTFHDFYS